MDGKVKSALEKLSKLIDAEKKELDHVLQGAKLLAEMLVAEEKNGQSREQSQIERSEPGLETETGRGEVSPIRPAQG